MLNKSPIMPSIAWHQSNGDPHQLTQQKAGDHPPHQPVNGTLSLSHSWGSSINSSLMSARPISSALAGYKTELFWSWASFCNNSSPSASGSAVKYAWSGSVYISKVFFNIGCSTYSSSQSAVKNAWSGSVHAFNFDVKALVEVWGRAPWLSRIFSWSQQSVSCLSLLTTDPFCKSFFSADLTSALWFPLLTLLIILQDPLCHPQYLSGTSRWKICFQ